MALYIRNVVLAALVAIALEAIGTSAGGAMPVDGRLGTMMANDSDVQQVRVVRHYGYVRPNYWRYGYARPYYRRYGYVRPYYWGPRYYSYRPAYYYRAPYGYWRRPYYYGGPVISFGFGFGPRFWW